MCSGYMKVESNHVTSPLRLLVSAPPGHYILRVRRVCVGAWGQLPPPTNLGLAPHIHFGYSLTAVTQHQHMGAKRSVLRPSKCVSPAGRGHDAPPDPVVVWGGDTTAIPPLHSARSALRFGGIVSSRTTPASYVGEAGYCFSPVSVCPRKSLKIY